MWIVDYHLADGSYLPHEDKELEEIFKMLTMRYPLDTVIKNKTIRDPMTASITYPVQYSKCEPEVFEGTAIKNKEVLESLQFLI